jgi:hypothetical protein
VQKNEQENVLLLDHIKDMHNSLRWTYTICWMKGHYEEAGKHKVNECELYNVLGMRGRKIKFTENSCCFKCCLSGHLCEYYGNHKVCKELELVKHWVEIKVDKKDVRMLETIEKVASRRFSFDSKGRKKLWEWMWKLKRVVGHNSINLFVVFCLSVQKCNF